MRNTKIIGKKIVYYDWVDSTNDLAHLKAREGEAEGTIVVANGQKTGRGRMGRTWDSPYKSGLYCSVILRPDVEPKHVSKITLMFAVAVVRALGDMGVEDAKIKWPNDIWFKDKKICGILTEADFNGATLNYIVSGIGLNVNTKEDDLPEGATSLLICLGKNFDLQNVACKLILRLDAYYQLFLEHKFDHILEEFRSLSYLHLGDRLRIFQQARTVEGSVAGLDEDGCLLLRRDNGFVEQITSGHVLLCK